MRREIKFRAWDRKNKAMFFSGEIVIYLDGTIFEWQMQDLEPTKNIEIMQFTGLKDKTGKDIYEGDVVKNKRGNVYSVIWKNCGFFFDEKSETMLINHTIIYDWEVEVIGNIYENLELLKTGASKNG
jgi:uncharacterized phage protein (TIGR01671 family)